jgi:hypothetical protein
MPPLINDQPPLKPAGHIARLIRPNGTNQTLAHHLGQENRQRIIIPKPRNLNRHLHPRSMTPNSSRPLLLHAIMTNTAIIPRNRLVR